MNSKVNKIDIKKVAFLILATIILVILTFIINSIEKYNIKDNIYNNKNEYANGNKVEMPNMNDEQNVDDSKPLEVVEESIIKNDINNDTVLYFESVENEITEAITNNDNDLSSKVKEKFVLLVDFIFYGTEINGITFDELTEDTKQKLIDIVNRIDIKIESKVPGYKETISTGAKESYDYLASKLKQGITYLEEKAEEKIGTEKYEEIKDNIGNSVDKVKDSGSKIVDKSKAVLDTAKSKIKNWYEGWK